jgi:hypothetical protein
MASLARVFARNAVKRVAAAACPLLPQLAAPRRDFSTSDDELNRQVKVSDGSMSWDELKGQLSAPLGRDGLPLVPVEARQQPIVSRRKCSRHANK